MPWDVAGPGDYADLTAVQHRGERHVLKDAERGILLQFGLPVDLRAGGGRGIDPAEEPGEPPWRRQRRVLLGSKALDVLQLRGSDLARRERRHRRRHGGAPAFPGRAQVAVSARRRPQGFAEVLQQPRSAAPRVLGDELHDPVQALHVRPLALQEPTRQPPRQRFDVHVPRRREKAVSLPRARHLERQVTLLLQVVQRGDDALAGRAGGGHRPPQVELEPRHALLRRPEQRPQERLPLRVERRQDLGRGPQRLELVLGVERAGRLDHAVELQVRQQRLDHERADVVRAGQVVGRDVEWPASSVVSRRPPKISDSSA